MLIKEKTKPIQRKPQQYHGHTIIELKNVRTGSRERVESDNEFTGGIGNFIRSLGIFNNSPWSNSTWKNSPSYQRLIGGILLFDKSIDPDPVDGVYPSVMPAGTKMIANGSYGVANSGNPTEMGSYNANESSANGTAITMVYDWSTSQGNGEIGCVCLTSDVGGYVGYGNSVSHTAHGTLRELDYNQSHDSGIYVPSNTNSENSAGLEGDTACYITARSTTEFIYAKKKFPVLTVDLHGEFAKTYTVEIPAALIYNNYEPYILYIGNGRFFVIPRRTMDAGASRMVGIYDEATRQWSYINFTVPAGTNYGFAQPYNVSVIDGKHFEIISTSDPTKKFVVAWDGSIIDINPGYKHCELTEDLMITFRGYPSYSYQYQPLGIYDKVNNTLYPINAQMRAYDLKTFLCDDAYIMQNIPQSGGDGFNVFRNPLYLATVNNISTVTKTSAQTMKVTYTVTPA